MYGKEQQNLVIKARVKPTDRMDGHPTLGRININSQLKLSLTYFFNELKIQRFFSNELILIYRFQLTELFGWNI